jgi:phosphatidylserine/phosphatidylglycerophosphate/cardiolipin synthase-like enzyme
LKKKITFLIIPLLFFTLACGISAQGVEQLLITLTPYVATLQAQLQTLTPEVEGQAADLQTTPSQTAVSPTGQITATPVDKSPIKIYLTDPNGPDAKSHTGGPEEILIKAIDQAQVSVDMAMYNLSLKSVGDALQRAAKRGVQVHLVMETDAIDGAVPQELKKAKITIVSDQREGLMHNKYTILDGKEVWTGSLNLTESSVYSDNNNLVLLQSEKAAQDYLNDFEMMFKKKKFGLAKESLTPMPEIDLAGTKTWIRFSPKDGVEKNLIQIVKSAKTSIDFLAYSFTSDTLAQAMRDRAKEGVKVRGVFDESQVKSNKGTEYDKLKAVKGFTVRLDGNPGLMHHKVIIIDGSIVAFGSYNFSNSAEKINDENSVVIFDAGVATRFMQEFEKIFSQAQK